jgi:signal transduction histidine kinase
LVLCHEMVEKNGGRIWAESIAGQGTTFVFTLPLSN